MMRSLLSVFVLFSLLLQLSNSLTLPIIGPYLDFAEELASGDGLVDGTLGAIGGALGIEAEFDYVVVGGGTGGNAIGTRLAEAGFTVAIIEAGGFYELGKPVLATTPLGDIIGIGSSPVDSNPLVDWQFVTTPQAGANNREIHYARGKCLGGSSALNFMVYQRGTKESYDEWASLVNDSSYAFDEILPYFENSVSFTPPNTEKRFANATTEYDSSVFKDPGGPVQVGYTNYVSPFSTWLAEAFPAAGMSKIQDFNAGSLIGSQYNPSTIRASDQTRSTSATYIKSATSNDNLKVYTLTMAEKILFDENKKATGVQVSSTGVSYKIKAKKEVIVSAGAFQSPQLLMVSGIGPADHLKEFDIEVVSDLAGVGQNMWDHTFFGPTYEVNMNTLTRALFDPVYLSEQLALYLASQEGPLASPVVDFIGWEKLPEEYRAKFSASTLEELAKFPADWPELELISGNGLIGNFSFPVLDQYLHGDGSKQLATILGTPISPTSRGTITLSSSSMHDPPLINPNWLTTKTDQEVAIATYRRLRQIWTDPIMASVVIGDEYNPGKEYESDEQILEVVRNSVMTLWHASCTCKMGTKEDEMAVIDNEARVFGVEGLRVVDASSFPILPPGHPQSTVYMLAEKIAAGIIAAK